MKWPILILAGFAATASADKDTDYPHRDWGHVATLDMSVAEATACIARALDKGGSVLVLPVDGGNDIDYSVDVPWGKRPDAWERFKLRNDGSFCDGKKLTAQDVAYSIKRWIDPATRSPVAWRTPFSVRWSGVRTSALICTRRPYTVTTFLRYVRT